MTRRHRHREKLVGVILHPRSGVIIATCELHVQEFSGVKPLTRSPVLCHEPTLDYSRFQEDRHRLQLHRSHNRRRVCLGGRLGRAATKDRHLPRHPTDDAIVRH